MGGLMELYSSTIPENALCFRICIAVQILGKE